MIGGLQQRAMSVARKGHPLLVHAGGAGSHWTKIERMKEICFLVRDAVIVRFADDLGPRRSEECLESV
jgi:hypothetical protein